MERINNLEEYKKLALRTLSNSFHQELCNSKLWHGIHGIITEISEMYEAFDTGKEIDIVNFSEEIGDCLWYVAICFEYSGIDTKRVCFSPYDRIQNDPDCLRTICPSSTKPGFFLTPEGERIDVAYSILSDISKISGKALDLFKKTVWYGKDFNMELFREYIVEIANNLIELADWAAIDITYIAKMNINKLEKRFPENFTENHANNRDIDLERKELQKVND